MTRGGRIGGWGEGTGGGGRGVERGVGAEEGVGAGGDEGEERGRGPVVAIASQLMQVLACFLLNYLVSILHCRHLWSLIPWPILEFPFVI